MNPTSTKSILVAVLVSLGFLALPARAEGDPAPTIQRELAMQKYKGCHFTDEMGKYLYECVKKNDGFGTHWCYDETLETYCPPQFEARKAAEAAAVPKDKPTN